MLYDEIQKIIDSSICDTKNTQIQFLNRLKEGSFTRDENPQTHYCVYFLPYNQQNKTVFIVHHKKAGLWLSPGGHIDQGEGLLETLNREIKEELGVKQFFQEPQFPFLLTITPIENKTQACKIHYDIWFIVLTDGSNFIVDLKEFYATKWVTIDEAEKIVTDIPNRKALDMIRKKFETAY